MADQEDDLEGRLDAAIGELTGPAWRSVAGAEVARAV